MGKTEHDSTRKRKRIPSEVISFIESLERQLEIGFLSTDGEGSHLQHDARPINDTRLVVSKNSCEMNKVTQAPVDTPFSGAMELIEKGLENVDVAAIRQTIDPIWQSLENLDAVAMLNLTETTDHHEGARISNGVYCKPIHELVTPRRRRKGTIVRYVHVSEVPEKYSVGIFIFPPNARIPLHDHPGMCVLSRVLYGDLQRLSLDLARPNDDNDEPSASPFFSFSRNKRKLPKGSRRVYLNQVDQLQAPDVTALYPFEGQLHEFQAGPNGAAVLDVLLPPYNETDNRDCTFYHIRPDSSYDDSDSTTTTTTTTTSQTHGRPCWIVPTGQPEDFHCLSGRYNELGGDFYDSDDDSFVDS